MKREPNEEQLENAKGLVAQGKSFIKKGLKVLHLAERDKDTFPEGQFRIPGSLTFRDDKGVELFSSLGTISLVEDLKLYLISKLY